MLSSQEVAQIEAEQNITCTLAPHMVLEIGLSLLKQWVELEHIKREQPQLKIDFVTLVQCFNKIGLKRATDILLETDINFLMYLKFTDDRKEAAKYFILHGCLPKGIDQQVKEKLKITVDIKT